MPTAKVAASSTQTVIGQWNIFGECDEITVNHRIKPFGTAPNAAAAESPVAPRMAAPPKIETIVPAVRKKTPAPFSTADELDFPLPGQRFDDGIVPDLETVDPSDSIETRLAKRMFLRMIWDLTPKPAPAATHDLFGQASTTSQAEQDRLDALVWMYSLNPDQPLVPFEWVCDVLGFDVHRVRRVTGRSMRKELKQLVNLLSTIIGADYARVCEETLSDYLDVSSWNLN